MTKRMLIVLLVIIISVALGFYYVTNKSKNIKSQQNQESQYQQKEKVMDVEKDEKVDENIVKGKLRSMNEKQIFIELSDGKGSAVNIESKTPVKKQGDDKKGNLSILKVGDIVSVKVDESNNAQEIVINN